MAFSRARDPTRLKVAMSPVNGQGDVFMNGDMFTKNVVWREVLRDTVLREGMGWLCMFFVLLRFFIVLGKHMLLVLVTTGMDGVEERPSDLE